MVSKIMVKRAILTLCAAALAQSAFGFTREFCDSQKEKMELGCSLSLRSCIKTSSSVEACIAASASCHTAVASSYEQCVASGK
jgi:hypothetical protein